VRRIVVRFVLALVLSFVIIGATAVTVLGWPS